MRSSAVKPDDWDVLGGLIRGERRRKPRDDEDRKPVCTYFGKRFGKIYLVCLLKNLSWQQIKRWDMTCHG